MHPKDLANEAVLQEYESADERRRHEIFLELWWGVKSYSGMPIADAVVAESYIGGALRIAPGDEDGEDLEMAEDGTIDLAVNGYRIREHFTGKWWLGDEPDQTHHIGGWSCDDLVRWSHLELYHRHSWGPRTIVFPPRSTLASHYGGLHTLISSAQLYYRLLATFDMTRNSSQQVDGYKSIWDAEFHWTGGSGVGHVRIYDNKGAASVQFRGCQRASTSALQLLEWLAGDNVPHTYDDLLAGFVA